MAGFFMGEETQERMDLWLTRALVLLSFAAHLTMALLAGIRRHRDSGMRRFLVWLAYYATEIGTPIALTKVFIDTAFVDSKQQLKVLVAYREQQMFAFWAPFLLLHLGRPDNITSYALENKGLSPTQMAVLVLAIVGAIYGSYKQRFLRGDGHLHAAFFIMLFFGSYKYVERAVALWRASFANIRRSNERKGYRFLGTNNKDRKRDNDDALLDAHGLLGFTMGAFAEYQVDPSGHRRRRTYYGGRSYSDSDSGSDSDSDSDLKEVSKIVEMEASLKEVSKIVEMEASLKEVCKIVEMEASLMYDMLYTKAIMIHTGCGYIIRVLSPPATATTLYLFHSKKGQATERADRMITYILLVGTLVLDVIWLLIALGSTWTYAFLVDREEDEEKESKGRHRWLKKAGRRAAMQSWYWLRHLLVSLDPSRLSLRSGPSGYRLLPGSGVGQRNLLHECSTPPGGRLEKMVSFFAGLGKKKIDVKDELLEVIRRCSPVEIDDDFMGSNRSYIFEIILIALHVATDIFLLCKSTSIKSETSAQYEKEIRAISDYMLFLLAERQHMVLKPGDQGSHYKKACLHLKEIWREIGTSGSPTTRETKQLANILLDMRADFGRRLHEINDTLGLGADWAFMLLHELDPATSYRLHQTHGMNVYRLEEFMLVFTADAQSSIKQYRGRREQSQLLDCMLKLILDSWVRLLTFTSQECSRESHAKKLSCGGELLTIVWLMKQHGELISKRE